MVETGICGKVMRVAPFRVCHFLLERGGIMVWSPDTYSCGHTLFIMCDDVTERSDKGPKGPGNDIFVSYLVTGVTRPCVGREQLSLGTSSQRRSHVAVGSSLARPFVVNPFPNTKLVRF